MSKFIVSFGSGQLGGFGNGYHIEVEAPTEMEARVAVSKAFDRQWSMIYPGDSDYAKTYGTRMLGKIKVYENGTWTTRLPKSIVHEEYCPRHPSKAKPCVCIPRALPVEDEV